MKILQILFIITILTACGRDDFLDKPYPCLDGKCETYYYLDPKLQPDTYQDSNGYWHIEFIGVRYFTIVGKLAELDPHYVINGVPLIETAYDSDYWIAFGSISFKVPIYSILSWFTNGDFNNLIPIGNLEYTLTDIAQLQPPLNVVGYQIQKNFCWECPYASTLIGTYSKYSYEPRKMVFLDEPMSGDTLKIIIETTFNSDIGYRVVKEDIFNIIVD